MKLRLTVYKSFVLFLVIWAGSFTCSSQNFHIVKFPNQADVKVFEVAYENQADLKVYRVNFSNQARGCNGFWYFSEFENQAKKKLFFVEFEDLAQLKIFYVKFPNQAGWVREDKKRLLCDVN